MNEHEVDEMKNLLRKSLEPAGNTELRHDLWPAMLRRVDQRAPRVPWWDWALLACVAAAFFLVPGIIPALLYHL